MHESAEPQFSAPRAEQGQSTPTPATSPGARSSIALHPRDRQIPWHSEAPRDRRRAGHAQQCASPPAAPNPGPHHPAFPARPELWLLRVLLALAFESPSLLVLSLATTQLCSADTQQSQWRVPPSASESRLALHVLPRSYSPPPTPNCSTARSWAN